VLVRAAFGSRPATCSTRTGRARSGSAIERVIPDISCRRDPNREGTKWVAMLPWKSSAAISASAVQPAYINRQA
jgi:hypothetical protein